MGHSWFAERCRLVRLPAKIGYAMGDLGLSIAYFALGFFFLFYLTDVVGMSAAVAGTGSSAMAANGSTSSTEPSRSR